MKNKIFTAIILLSFVNWAQAQELWMLPGKFFLQPWEKLVVHVQTGGDFIGESMDLKKDQIESLTLHHPTMNVNLMDSVTEGTRDNLIYTAATEGTFLLAMQSKTAVKEWEADAFNIALKEQGLDDILEQR
jgi:hypothetical protein